jgi:MFS transporter, UMF1 family
VTGPAVEASIPAEAGPLADPRARRREQRGWYFYDWANSAYVTTIGTVLLGPYLISVAEKAACGYASDETRTCSTTVHLLGIPVAPGSLPLYLVTASTLLSAVLLPLVGAVADRARSKRRQLAAYAWVGAAAAMSLVLVSGTDWQLGAICQFVANIALAASLVVYDAILCEIAAPDERDRVSSRGWALGYLGGGLLLAVNLAMVVGAGSLEISTGTAVRIGMFSAGLWWGAFTLVPYFTIRDRPPVRLVAEVKSTHRRGTQSFHQLAVTMHDLRRYPMALAFLTAYLFFNDGIQTVISAAAIYADKQLFLSETVQITTILLVQFVAFGGALIFGRLASRFGAKRVIAWSLLAWMAVVVSSYFLPVKQVVPFLTLAVAIGIVLGGTQALSRSFYSLLIPAGRQAEFFSLYQACERGTSWLGTLVFGLVHQLTHSYRPAIAALVVFFAVGGLLLLRVNAAEGIRQAQQAPAQT